MAEQVSIDVLINTANAANSIGEIKSAMRDLKSAALEAGEGSAEFMKIGQAAGQLQDRINDVNDTVRVLAGNRMEQLTRSFSSVAQAGIGGFQAIAGAQAFFGSENEDLQKQMVKLQGLLNLSQGIAQFANIGQAAKDFKIVMASLIPSLFTATAAQNGLNVAMSLNPAGIVVAAIAALAAAYFIFSDSAEDAAKRQAEFNKELEENEKRNLALNEARKKRLKESDAKGEAALEREIELLKARGASIDEIFKKENEYINNRIINLEALRYTSAKTTKEEEEEIKDLYNEKAILEIKYQKDLEDIRFKAIEKSVKEDDLANRQLEKNREARLDIIKEFNVTYDDIENEFDRIRLEHKYWTDEQIYASIKKRLADEKKLKDDAVAEDILRNKLEIERANERIEYEKYVNEQYQLGREERSRVKEQYHLSDAELDRKFAEMRMKYMDTEKYSSEELYKKVAENEQKKRDEFNKTTNTVMNAQIAATNTLINLDNLATAIEMRNLKQGEELSLEVQKKQFKRKKALAVVEAVINTQLAMISMLKDPGGIEGFILAGVARLNGMLAVATILAQKFQPDGGTSSMGSIANPGLSQSVGFGAGSIQGNPSSQSPTNAAISPNFFGTAGAFYGNNPPVQAYVLENEMTDAQLRAERLRNRARLR